MSHEQAILALDVGEKRIGVAIADSKVKIAIPFETIVVDGDELKEIIAIIEKERVGTLVIGYPRNQSGEATAQTDFVEQFAKQLSDLDLKIVFQDESLTSVEAEKQLQELGGNYEKSDIDKRAAAIILQDYLEAH